MGDRSNIYFPDDSGKDRLRRGIYLYSHWEGPALFEYAQAALDSSAARSRWNDAPYLTRIVVQHILMNHADSASGSGWGLSPSLCDNEYPILVIDASDGRVWFAEQSQETSEPATEPAPWTFAQFVALAKIPLPRGTPS
jgi:hypothetical protein